MKGFVLLVGKNPNPMNIERSRKFNRAITHMESEMAMHKFKKKKKHTMKKAV